MAAAADNSYLPAVIEKMKRHEEYSGIPEEEQKKLARELTDHEQIFNRFSHLLAEVDEEIASALRDDDEKFSHSVELEKAHQRAKHGIARVRHLPVKLFLSRLERVLPAASITAKLSEQLLEFGALHAGLVVGNIRLEWGRESLIDPQWEDTVIVEDDFVAHCHQQGQWALETSAYDKKFSLADRERRVRDKIELILESAEQKRQLLINLVEIIVEYNRSKHYSLRNCNCQSFVIEAMKALGIKETPKFSGQLNDYLQKLKNYQVDVPDQFTNHATLDAHVKQKLQADTLTQHDMEYLLHFYYRLHVSSIIDADGDENWQCKVDTCQYEFLADRVDRQAMLCNQFLKPQGNTSTARGVQRPTNLSTISEAGGHLETRSIAVTSNPTRDVRMSTDHGYQQPLTPKASKYDQLQKDLDMARKLAESDQKKALEAYTPKGYYSKVEAKLRKLPKYEDKFDQEIHDLVEALTSVEEFRANYDCFRAVVEMPSQDLALDASIDKDSIDRAQLHLQVATGKVAERYENVCKFPVKLVLCLKPPRCGGKRRGSIVEGSLHEGLLICDHLFEWDESSLVIPRRANFGQQPALTTGILYGSEWFTYVDGQKSKLEAAISSPTDRIHGQEIDLMFDLTFKKDNLITSVIETIVNYNRNKHYNRHTCNNRHFICDVTKALGVKKLPAFGVSLKQQLDKSKRQCSRTLARTKLANHADLDTYVCNLGEEKLRELTIVDLEYLVGKYFHYHVESWEVSGNPDQWSCQQVNCQLASVEKQLERTALSVQSNCVLL